MAGSRFRDWLSPIYLFLLAAVIGVGLMMEGDKTLFSCAAVDNSTLTLAEKMLCPLCGSFNRCGLLVQGAGSDCWCNDVKFSSGIFEKIPEDKRGKQCVCVSCAANFSV